MDYEITIIVDTNDDDLLSQSSRISENKINQLIPLIEKIKLFQWYEVKLNSNTYFTYSHNFPVGECCREHLGEKNIYELYGEFNYLLDLFIDLCPYAEYGFHTIKSIEIEPCAKKEKLL